MTYANDTATLVKAIDFINRERDNAATATDNTKTNGAALTNDLDTLTGAGRDAVSTAVAGRIRAQLSIKAMGRAILLAIFAQIARTINSPTVNGESITDLDAFFRDWRYYQDNTADEKVTARSVTYASEPSASANGVVRRLTVGPWQSGDKIESGRHGTTVTARVTSKQGWNQSITLDMGDGPADALDYKTGGSVSGAIQAISEVNTGGLVGNSKLTGNADVSDNAAVTVITGWTLTNTTGTPTPKIEKTAGKIFRSNSYAISVDTNSTTWTISRNVENIATSEPFVPVLMGVPVYMNTSWTGTITLGWGSKTQAFTESDLTATDWVWLFPDRDVDLYPVNWDQDDPEWSVAIAQTSANEVVIGGVFAAKGTKYEDAWYWYFADQAMATVNSTFTMADSNSNAGVIQDTLGFVFDDESVGAYLMTAGTNTLADP